MKLLSALATGAIISTTLLASCGVSQADKKEQLDAHMKAYQNINISKGNASAIIKSTNILLNPDTNSNSFYSGLTDSRKSALVEAKQKAESIIAAMAADAKLNSEADKFIKTIDTRLVGDVVFEVKFIDQTIWRQDLEDAAKAVIDKGLKDAKAEKDNVKIRAFANLQERYKKARTTEYLDVDWSSKSTDRVIEIAEEIRNRIKAGTLIDKEGAKKVQAELKSRLAARQMYGNLADTNNQAAHDSNAQMLMTTKEANSFYAGNPSICTGNYKQYYKVVCQKVFGQF